MCNIAQKLLMAYQDEDECDVKLILKSGKILQCHGVVLKLASDFFKTRLSATWCNGNAYQEIDCTAFDDLVVTDIINFMYGVPCVLDENSVPSILKCSTFFLVSELTSRCEDVLLNSLDNKTVIESLVLSNMYDLEKLSDACFNFLDCHLEHIEGEEFLKLPKELLIRIISRDTLSVHEHHLFSIIKTWVEMQEDTENMWNEIRPHLRFCSMSFDFFVENCVIDNITGQNWGKLLLYLSSAECKKTDLNDLPINSKSRQTVSVSDSFAQRCIMRSVSPDWLQDSLDGDRLNITCDKEIYLKAISLYGTPESSIFTSVSVYDSESKEQLADVLGRMDFGSECTAFLRLETSLPLKANKRYTIVSRQKRTCRTFFGRRGIALFTMSRRNGSVVNIKFETANVGNTDVKHGQFHGFLFKEIV